MSPAEIKEARKQLGKTQKQFADLLKVSFRAVQSWESGLRNPSTSTSFHIKAILENDEKKAYNVPHTHSVTEETAADYLKSEKTKSDDSDMASISNDLISTVKKLKGDSQDPKWIKFEKKLAILLNDHAVKSKKIEEISLLLSNLKSLVD